MTRVRRYQAGNSLGIRYEMPSATSVVERIELNMTELPRYSSPRMALTTHGRRRAGIGAFMRLFTLPNINEQMIASSSAIERIMRLAVVRVAAVNTAR